jgi:hypothetical protein
MLRGMQRTIRHGLFGRRSSDFGRMLPILARHLFDRFLGARIQRPAAEGGLSHLAP